MKEIELIQTALMLAPPWNVVECQLDINQNHLDIHLDIHLDFTRGSRFSCPDCGQAECAVHDTVPKSWRHLNLYQYSSLKIYHK